MSLTAIVFRSSIHSAESSSRDKCAFSFRLKLYSRNRAARSGTMTNAKVHRQIFASDETIDYAFMGQDPNAADNRWLREAFGNQVPIIYFLGIAPGRYQAVVPTFVTGWGAEGANSVRCAGARGPRTAGKRFGAALWLAYSQATAASGVVPRSRHYRLQWPLRVIWPRARGVLWKFRRRRARANTGRARASPNGWWNG